MVERKKIPQGHIIMIKFGYNVPRQNCDVASAEENKNYQIVT